MKSRFFSVGVDQTQQFQPVNMSFLANKIANEIPFDFYQKDHDTKE